MVFRSSSTNSSQHLAHRRAAAGRQAPVDRSADQYAAGAQREGLEHVRALADAAVDQHVHLVADLVDDLGEHVQGGWLAVELPAALIRHHHRAQPAFTALRASAAVITPLAITGSEVRSTSQAASSQVTSWAISRHR